MKKTILTLSDEDSATPKINWKSSNLTQNLTNKKKAFLKKVLGFFKNIYNMLIGIGKSGAGTITFKTFNNQLLNLGQKCSQFQTRFNQLTKKH